MQNLNQRELGIKHALEMLRVGDSLLIENVFMMLYDNSNAKDNDKNDDVIVQMENIIKDKYHGQERIGALRHLKLLCLFRKEKKEIERLFSYNLDRIMEIARMHNIRVILMDYPIAVLQIKDILRKKAEAYGIPLIDNYAIFEAKLKQAAYKREDLFVGDGHCNAAGYNLVAENVYKVLIENKMIHAGAIEKNAD